MSRPSCYRLCEMPSLLKNQYSKRAAPTEHVCNQAGQEPPGSTTAGQGSMSAPPPGRLPGARGAGEGAVCFPVSPEQGGSTGKALLAQLTAHRPVSRQRGHLD